MRWPPTFLNDPFVQEKIGLSQAREGGRVKEVFRAAAERQAGGEGEAYDKMLAILTPEQQEKLRKRLSADGAL